MNGGMSARTKNSSLPSNLTPADYFQLAVSRGDAGKIANYLKANDYRVDDVVIDLMRRLLLGNFQNIERVTHRHWWLEIKYRENGRPKIPIEYRYKRCLKLLTDASPSAMRQIAKMFNPNSSVPFHLVFRRHCVGNPSSRIRGDIKNAINELKFEAELELNMRAGRKNALHKAKISRTAEWRARQAKRKAKLRGEDHAVAPR